MNSLDQAMQVAAQSVQETLESLLLFDDCLEDRVVEAMRYASLGGGKRIRPFMVLTTASLFEVDRYAALRAAAAVEMVHCYSLVHDDLPAMDNDDLRRGKPTTHKHFDEATAILAGDALLTRAFGVLAHEKTHGDPQVRADLVLALAKAAGDRGMIGGQMLDILAETTELNLQDITRLQRKKTGMLISVSCEMGAILGKASEPAKTALNGYAHDLGVAFQIADDLLDVESSAEIMGKATGKDVAAGKATFVSLLGAERAREQAAMLSQQAIEHLDIFEEKADYLRQLALFVVERSH